MKRRDARRIAIRAQLLDANRPDDFATVVDQLTLLQLDPTAAVAPSADLVAWTRLGDAYTPDLLQRALEIDHTVFEHRGQESPKEPAVAMVRPMARLGLYLAEMRAWPSEGGRVHQWLEANVAFRSQVLDTLRTSGPLRSRDIPDTCAVSWASSGWTNDRNVTQMLEFLAWRGEVAVAGRQGRQRVWDVSERIYPSEVKAVPAVKAKALRDERRLRALGVARPEFVGDAGIPVDIDGTTGQWRVDPDASAAGFKGRTAILSPFDRLIHDRARALQLFGFDYTLEMYKPQSQRRWGYFALPVLHGDALVGKVDAIADRKTSALRVNAIHEDVPFTSAMTKAVNAELEALRRWLGLEHRA
jgi:uncharacterized protein YcaQ